MSLLVGAFGFMTVVRAVGSICIIMAFGVVLFRDLAWLGTKVTSSGRGEVVIVVVVPLPKRRGGAKFLEASHNSTIIFQGNSQLTSRRGKGQVGITDHFWGSSSEGIWDKCRGTHNSRVR